MTECCYSMGDPASQSNFDEIVVTHYALKWDVCFEKKTLAGSVAIKATTKKNTDKMILDGRGLVISSASVNGTPVKFSMETTQPLGVDKITIHLPASLDAGKEVTVDIAYSTASEATALQFLNKEQTTDKKSAYLFSQCQAIHARSIVPCQDTPSVKSSYEAEVCVPSGLACLMSAIGSGSRVDGGKAVFSFKQPVPIPSYLLAIVVGTLEKRDISPRCAVWAEPSVVDACHWEFEETEKILKTAEDIAGKYVWGRYDLVVLPATFPFGGMENPCLTFVTPTLISGDRSNVNVVAHEIAHSWTGNLVTNANWEHFWLNEGFTVFLERKIHGRMFGEKERQFESERGWEEALVPTVKLFGPDHEFTKLIQNQKGIDPDDAFSSIPYEKGSAFLLHIEQKLGNNAKFEEFLRHYIAKYAHKSIRTDSWKSELYSFFADQKAVLDTIHWDKWLTAPGVPAERPKYDTCVMDECRRVGAEWLSGSPPSSADPFKRMTPSQQVAVVDVIRAAGTFPVDRMEQLTSSYGLDGAKNCELRFSWLMLGLEKQWQPIVPPALAFVLTVGRLKYCKPIYKALFGWPVARQQAVDQFNKQKRFMHPITANIISKLL